MRRLLALLLPLALIASLPSAPAAARARGSQAVIAVIDTGINPYHETFRDNSPLAFEHPSSYIPGFPKDAKALRLSLHEIDWETAVRKDCARVWSKIKTGKLYWFPGTKIIGGITFEQTRALCGGDGTPTTGRILDYGAHGTMTASRAASSEYGACKDCRVVMVQGFSTRSVRWAGQNSNWIDLQTNSWGPTAPLWEPTGASGLLVNNPPFVRTVERAARKHLAFWASGNGVLTRWGVLGHPTLIDPRLTPSAISVGGMDSGYINLWPDFPPHVVSDSCNSWAAYHDRIDESAEDVGGGTSGASPFAAGGAAHVLLFARRLLGDRQIGVDRGVVARGRPGVVDSGPLADGKFTLKEWRNVVLKTASPRPRGQFEDGSVCDAVSGLVLYSSTPVRWEDVPDGYPEFLHIGYGAVDNRAYLRAVRVLRGDAKMPNRDTTDAYFTADDAVRSALYDVWTTGP